ncbi:mannose-6-phosphate isomerase, class I [Alkaliphilus peptidifermentans]|uniref:mannose-6-phosphate isomerase n=1 Tax=Alkaliphilus peptidifermentans DSM 18978 TaxID=1120976 RepID=A0A1G5KRR3_9FIRM|nr:mannose-6-phosphate isomerase, class I [Alkaliphilus peptidifermentans]SCZ03285.1 mannose-6-phosphate isomerase, type 1 [Alkaliphilus peptidifermentans DSM 18978]
MKEKELIFLNKLHYPKIWGSEDWVISAHSNGDCKISNGRYYGMTLSWLWHNKRELFGNLEGEVFPLLTKIINAKDDLSIQVHPDDTYAKENANGELGKTECWYIIDCDSDAELILGHNAETKEEMKNMIEDEKWENLLRRVKINPGDFFYIPAGTIHGIKKGTVILEIQQSSDVTYRLYDYGRLDKGRLRDLHIKESIDVTTIPHVDYKISNKIEEFKNAKKELLVKDKYFTLYKITIKGIQQFENDRSFMMVSVIKGEGTIDGIKIEEGLHFIIPASYKEFQLEGKLDLIISTV